ncbi:MAG: MYXO-CTERM sorting domain-containing protein [Gammaproteobacteria bacterium]
MKLHTDRVIGAAVVALALQAPVAGAATLPGARLFVIDQESTVQAFFVGGEGAGLSNDLYLHSPSYEPVIFNNHSAGFGESHDLGFFAPGTELVFRLHTSDDNDFFTGAAAENPDGVIHAVVDDEYVNSAFASGPLVLVSFEDLFDGGDFNYEDMVFALSNVTAVPAPVPVPALAPLAGLAALGLLRRRRLR